MEINENNNILARKSLGAPKLHAYRKNYTPVLEQDENRNLIVPETNNYKAYFAPNLSFNFHAKEIKNAFFITDTKDNEPITKNEDGSYTLNDETETKVYFGKPALDLINSSKFENDTQIIFPKKCSGKLIRNGKEIPVLPDSAVQISSGAGDDITVLLDKNSHSPIVYTSKKNYPWYEKYEKNSDNENIHNKFLEMIYFASSAYNAKFTPNLLISGRLKNEKYLNSLSISKNDARNRLVEILYEKRDLLTDEERKEVELAKGISDKLKETGLAEEDEDNYLMLKRKFNPTFQEEQLAEKGFKREEIEKLMPVLNGARQIRLDSTYARKNHMREFGKDLTQKMKQAGIFVDNKKKTEFVYWKTFFGNENQLKEALYNAKDKNGEKITFSENEINRIVEGWKKENLTGYDMTGLKYLDNKVAVYNLDDKINVWNQEETNWATNSTAISSTDRKTQSFGVSLVRYDAPLKIISMNKLRMGEALHRHPNKENMKQNEVYFVTSGKAVLDVRKEGKIKEVVLNAGDLAVIKPNVEHCVNVVQGSYEHVCAQIPSAFHYGFGMKELVEDNEDSKSKIERGKNVIEARNKEQRGAKIARIYSVLESKSSDR